jgi:hypothetical protein
MSTPQNELAAMIAAEEGVELPAVETPAPAEPTPAEPTPAEPPPAEPAPAEPAAAGADDDIDLTALPEKVRAMVERERARASDLERKVTEAERKARAEFQRAQQAAGQLKRVQSEMKGLARQPAAGVPSPTPTPAPAASPATGGAPALTPPGTTAGHAAAVQLLQSDGWKRLLRDYPEFEEIGTGFTVLASELQAVRHQLTQASEDDPRVRRLTALEQQLSELTRQNEQARFASFEREHQPEQHVHVRIVKETDPETGQTYRRHVVEPRSPAFAWFYYSLPADVRDGIDWDDPEDLSALFADMRSAATEKGLIAAPAAASPAAPAAPAAVPVPPGNRSRITVAAVPRAPNAGVTRTAPASPMTPQQSLAAMIAEEEGRAL